MKWPFEHKSFGNFLKKIKTATDLNIFAQNIHRGYTLELAEAVLTSTHNVSFGKILKQSKSFR